MAERHIEGAVRGGKGHYEGRCAAERPLRDQKFAILNVRGPPT